MNNGNQRPNTEHYKRRPSVVCDISKVEGKFDDTVSAHTAAPIGVDNYNDDHTCTNARHAINCSQERRRIEAWSRIEEEGVQSRLLMETDSWSRERVDTGTSGDGADRASFQSSAQTFLMLDAEQALEDRVSQNGDTSASRSASFTSRTRVNNEYTSGNVSVMDEIFFTKLNSINNSCQAQKGAEVSISLQYFETSKQIRVIIKEVTGLNSLRGDTQLYGKLFCKISLMPGEFRNKTGSKSTCRPSGDVTFNDELHMTNVTKQHVIDGRLRVRVYNKTGFLSLAKCIAEGETPLGWHNTRLNTTVWCPLTTRRNVAANVNYDGSYCSTETSTSRSWSTSASVSSPPSLTNRSQRRFIVSSRSQTSLSASDINDV